MARGAALAGFVLACLAILVGPTLAQLRGHGGPVRAVAVTADGALAVSGSFDSSAIIWALDLEKALGVLRFHEGAVNAVATLPDGRIATGGADGRIALWRLGRPEPETVLTGHDGPVVALAVAADGAALASASWDGTARIFPLVGGEATVLRGHQGNVNGVTFLDTGRTVVTAGYDATLRFWRDGRETRVVTLPTALNALVTGSGVLAAGGADGIVRLLTPDGAVRAESAPIGTPVVALAVSPDGRRVAAAGVQGAVVILDADTAASTATLIGPGLPVWSLAFRDDRRLVTGGGDRLVRQWDVTTGEPIGVFTVAAPPPDSFGDDRGAQLFRACAACHSLTPDGGNRAGPTLHGVFGRKIATAPGYAYSPALRGMDIVWSAETIGRLFELGPSTYTPGTKMPEQTVGNADDRAALVRFLERATRP